MTQNRPAPPRHAAPNPGAVAIVYAALFVAGLLTVTLFAGAAAFPTPFTPPDEIIAYFRTHQGVNSICAFLQFGAAIPLGIYTATMTSRLRFYGIRVAGVDIALFGGFCASFMSLSSAIALWVLARPGIAADGPLVLTLYSWLFATGGPGFSVPFGLLMAGIAVPAFFMRLLPRWLSASGIVLAAIGELSALSLIASSALFLVPLTRFPGFIWLIAAGFLLPASRSRSTPRRVAAAS